MAVVTESKPADHEPGNATPQETDAPLLRIRYRIRFGKTGLLRWISHRDLARLWERLLRRTQLKLSMTEGFHPKPRIAFPSALALGVESLDEVVEIELAEPMTPQDLLIRLDADQQPGLTIKSVIQVPERSAKAQLQTSHYSISIVDAADRRCVQTAIERLMQQDTVSVERKKKTLTVTVTEQITQLEMDGDVIQLQLAASESASLRPGDVLDLLGFGDWIERGSLIRRTRVELKQELTGIDPESVAVSADWEAALNEHESCREASP